jgi:putative acetyltransferase
MTNTYTVRDATSADHASIGELNTRAFGRPDEARIVVELRAEGAVMMELVAEMDGQVVGHCMFYAVRVFGKLGCIGLGPMCVEPWIQKEGVGKALIHYGLTYLQKEGVSIVFVLGHPDYYTKFGFTTEATADFQAPYSGPAFMAVRLRYGPPMSGRLLFPEAFGVEP